MREGVSQRIVELTRALWAFLNKACQEKVFPGCVFVYGRPRFRERRVIFTGLRGLTRNREAVTKDLVYDLASLTKVLSTTSLLMMAIDLGLIKLSTSLGALDWEVPDDLKAVTILDLLSHRSGLPPWRPYWADQGLAQKERLKATILRERPLFERGQGRLYSDLNFMLLGFLIEELLNDQIAELFEEKIAKKLNLSLASFNSANLKLAPTEDGPRVGGPLDYPGLKMLGPVPLGRVHDDNAALLGGAAGHAGLFSSALDVWSIIEDWAQSQAVDQGFLVSQRTILSFLSEASSQGRPPRAAGFDIGQGLLEGFRGHLGYSGGSFWWNPLHDKAYVLLCNRVHPTARGSKMDSFRAALNQNLIDFLT